MPPNLTHVPLPPPQPAAAASPFHAHSESPMQVIRHYASDPPCGVCTCGAQAWRNFTLELRSLRESFRFDDYANIAEVNPPASPVGRAAYRVGQAVVDAFGALDRTLEERKVRWVVGYCEVHDGENSFFCRP